MFLLQKCTSPTIMPMSKVKKVISKLMNNKTFLSLALTVITVAEVSTQTCTVWILGQEDMPDELI